MPDSQCCRGNRISIPIPIGILWEFPQDFHRGKNLPHSHSHGMIMGIPKGFLSEMQRSASDYGPDRNRTEPSGFRSVRRLFSNTIWIGSNSQFNGLDQFTILSRINYLTQRFSTGVRSTPGGTWLRFEGYLEILSTKPT